MSEYIIESTEFLPLSRISNAQEEAHGMLKNSERIAVKFVLIEQRERVLKLLVFTFDDIWQHVDIAWQNMDRSKKERDFFGAGYIYQLQSPNTGGAGWDSRTCVKRFKRDAPEIDPAEGEAILRQVKERALQCLTRIANGEVSS